MKKFFSGESRPGVEEEKERETPVLTVYILRHGETEEDKTKPNRGLTETGLKQLRESAQLIAEELDPTRDIIQLYEAGTPRTKASNQIIAEILSQRGFKFFEPLRMDKGGHVLEEGVKTTTEINQGVYHRLKYPHQSESDAKKYRDDAMIRERMTVPADIKDTRLLAWYLLSESGELDPESVGPEASAKRIQEGVNNTTKLIPRLAKQLGPDQRIVTLININAPQLDAFITSKTGRDALQRHGGVENAQGFKLDFNLTNKDEDKVVFNEWPNN